MPEQIVELVMSYLLSVSAETMVSDALFGGEEPSKESLVNQIPLQSMMIQTLVMI